MLYFVLQADKQINTYTDAMYNFYQNRSLFKTLKEDDKFTVPLNSCFFKQIMKL